TLAEPDPARKRRTYWLIGITLFTSWNAGTALGVLLGGATGDPGALGLDAAFPAGLLALIMPSLHDRDTRLVAFAGAVIAVTLTPFVPAGLPVLCALLGLLAVFRPHRKAATAARETAAAQDPAEQTGAGKGGAEQCGVGQGGAEQCGVGQGGARKG